MSRGKFIIVGAGIAGISAAWRLQKQGFDVTVYDLAEYVGGRMKTVKKQGFSIDVGAGLLIDTYAETIQLIRDAGLEGQMETTRGKLAILRDGKLHKIDLDHMQWGFLKSGVLSLMSKLQLVKPVFRMIKARDQLNFYDLGLAADLDTESLSSYCHRELSPELLDYLLGPIVRMMYLHSPDDASMVEVLWALKFLMSGTFSLRGGMEVLPKTLASDLDVRLCHEALSLSETEDGVVVSLRDPQGETMTDQADVCIVTGNARALLNLHGGALSERQKTYLAELPYSHDFTVHFCLDSEPAIDATMVQIPEADGGELAALVIDHNKAKGLVPDGKGMVTAHFLSTWGERLLNQSDEIVLSEATGVVSKIIPEVATRLESFHIERWTHAATMARPGDFVRLAGFMEDIDKSSRVRYIGDYMALSSVNVAVATAGKLVEEVKMVKMGSE